MNLPSLVEVRLSDNLLSRLLPLSISATPELRYVYLQVRKGSILSVRNGGPALTYNVR